MTFEEILDQAMAMLQRHGRLTYGILKRQCQLDDAALEDLSAPARIPPTATSSASRSCA